MSVEVEVDSFFLIFCLSHFLRVRNNMLPVSLNMSKENQPVVDPKEKFKIDLYNLIKFCNDI